MIAIGRAVKRNSTSVLGMSGHNCLNSLRAWVRPDSSAIHAGAPVWRGDPTISGSPTLRSALRLASTWRCLTWAQSSSAVRIISALVSAMFSSSSICCPRCLKRWNEEGGQPPNPPLGGKCATEPGVRRRLSRRGLDDILANFPNSSAAWLLRFLLFPFGVRTRGPSMSDAACARHLFGPSRPATADVDYPITRR